MHAGKRVVCWLSTTSNMLSSLHQIYFVGGVFGGSWRMAGLFLRLGPARSTLKQRPGISIAPIYFSLDFKITLTLMQTGENIKKWRTLFFFFLLFRGVGNHLIEIAPSQFVIQRNPSNSVNRFKCDSFQRVSFFHPVACSAWAYFLCFSSFFLLERDKRLLPISPFLDLATSTICCPGVGESNK